MISRNAAGRATVRAVRLMAPLRLDGSLDERVYADVQALSDFIQQEPREGALATETTEAWVLFDDDNIYVSAPGLGSAPESKWIVNEMRRDSTNILRNEGIHFSFDTFYDRRNGVIFDVNAIGGRRMGQTTLERNWNGDWNPVWDVRTGRFEGGWTMEAADPVQVAALSTGPRPDLGLQHPSGRAMEERDVVAHASSGGAGLSSPIHDVAVCDAGRSRGASERPND